MLIQKTTDQTKKEYQPRSKSD